MQKSVCITWPLTLILTLSTPWMRALLGTIVCKFGSDPATSVVEVAICAKFTDGRTTDASRLHKLMEWAKNYSIPILIWIQEPLIPLLRKFHLSPFVTCWDMLQNVSLCQSGNGEESCKMIENTRKKPDRHQNLTDWSLGQDSSFGQGSPLWNFHRNLFITFGDVLFAKNHYIHVMDTHT